MAGAVETGNTGGNVGICEHPCDHAKQARQAFARPVRSAHNMKYLCKHTAARDRPAREPLLEHAQRQSALKSRHLQPNPHTSVCPVICHARHAVRPHAPAFNPNPAMYAMHSAKPTHRRSPLPFAMCATQSGPALRCLPRTPPCTLCIQPNPHYGVSPAICHVRHAVRPCNPALTLEFRHVHYAFSQIHAPALTQPPPYT